VSWKSSDRIVLRQARQHRNAPKHVITTFPKAIVQQALRIFAALRAISPNATTAADLARHLATTADAVHGALDLLGSAGAIDTMPRGEARIARLSARLRLRGSDANVVGLA